MKYPHLKNKRVEHMVLSLLGRVFDPFYMPWMMPPQI